MQLSNMWDPQDLTLEQQQRATAAAAAASAGSHKPEQLNRHWLLEMSEAELGVARSAGDLQVIWAAVSRVGVATCHETEPHRSQCDSWVFRSKPRPAISWEGLQALLNLFVDGVRLVIMNMPLRTRPVDAPGQSG